MIKLQKMSFVLLMALILVFGMLFVSAEDSEPLNDTNQTNHQTNQTDEKKESKAEAAPMAAASFVSLTVNPPSIDLRNVNADGSLNTFTNAIKINIFADGDVDLYVRANSDFTGNLDRIPLNNFEHGNYGNSSLPSRMAFTTDYTKVRSFKPNFFGFVWVNNLPTNLYLTVSSGTEAGTYNTTIYHTAVPYGVIP